MKWMVLREVIYVENARAVTQKGQFLVFWKTLIILSARKGTLRITETGQKDRFFSEQCMGLLLMREDVRLSIGPGGCSAAPGAEHLESTAPVIIAVLPGALLSTNGQHG